MNEAIRDWIANVETTHYLIGSAAGPHPYPMLVRDLQSVIGREARAQILEREGRLPDAVVRLRRRRLERDRPLPPVPRRRACALVGVEAGGDERGARGHARSAAAASRCCTARAPTCSRRATARCSRRHSISAGLDYPGVGPEHSYLKDAGRAEYVPRHRRRGARGVPPDCAGTEGIIPALESAHALSPPSAARELGPAATCWLVGLSGRGDKDVDTVRGDRRGEARARRSSRST